MKAYRTIRIAATAVLLLLLAPTLSAQQEKISLNLNNASLKVFFNEIEKQTEWTFSYRDSEIERKPEITITVKDSPLSDVLNSGLTPAGLLWKIVGDKIVITPSHKDTAPQQDETVTVSGRLTDSRGEALIGASARVKGTTN